MDSNTNNIEENDNNHPFEQNNNFFQIEFDDLIVASNFTSDLFDLTPEQAEQQLIIPQNVSIVDFLNDPVAFTAVSSPEIVWSTILSPILIGKPETKPYMLQLITILFKYFKDHPISFIENEMNRRNENIETANRDRNTLVATHYAGNRGPVQNYEDFISKNFENEFSISSKTNFFEVTHKLHQIANENLTERHAFALFKWGIFSEDISSIIDSLSFFGQLLNLQKKNSRVSFDFTAFKDSFFTLPLNNAFFSQKLQTPVSTTEIYEFVAPTSSSSFMSCDTSYIYVINFTGTVTRINLSTENIDIFDRFTKFPLFDNNEISSQIGIAVSNGYAIVLDFKIKPIMYKLPNFECPIEISMNQNQKLCFPFTSDGFYIYSLQILKKKLNIFILNSNGCSFIKSVTLQFSDKKMQIPQNSIFSTFCNGSIYTMALFDEKVGDIYKYVFRHFSVLDGSYLGDETIESKWEILSMINYPWDRKVFEIGKVGLNYTIFKLPNYSSQPPWLSRSAFADITFQHELSTARRVKDAFVNVLNFLSFYSFNLHGFSFRSFFTNSNYSVRSSQFFSPCTIDAISTIIKTISIFIRIFYYESKAPPSSRSPLHNNENLPKEWAKSVMFVLFRLLDMNLSNFVNRQGNEGRPNISIEGKEDEIIDCFMLVKNNYELHYLLPMICFILTNSFQIFFRNPTKRLHELFSFLYDYLIIDDQQATTDSRMNEDLFYYMIKQTSNYPEFAYLLSRTEIRHIFSKIITKLKAGTIKLCQKEFLMSYMRTVMLEMCHTYSSFQGDFLAKEKLLEDSFHCFSTIVVEGATPFFGDLEYDEKSFDEKKFDCIPFVIFFKKWLALLEPFPQFNKASLLITSFIQPIDKTIAQMIKDKKISCEPILGEKRFHKLSLIFYEMFSLFVNSISALLDGGAEIKEVCQYEWLYQSSKKNNNNNISINEINGWVRNIDSDVGIKTIGISFQCKESAEMNIRPVDRSNLAYFINELIRFRKPTESIEKLMNYLHQKVKNPINLKMNEQEKKIERIILAALVKQLGLTRELYEVSVFLETQSNPVISHLLKQTMTTLYRIRNQIKLSKQMTAQVKAGNSENRGFSNLSSYENYDNFITEIRLKTAFLLNIDSWLRNNQTEKDFTDMLKQLQVFITSKISISKYLEIIQSAVKSSNNIMTGIALLSSTLEDSLRSHSIVDKVCSSYMIERLFSNDSIHYYLSTLGKGFLQVDVAKIVNLFPLLIKMIEKQSIEVSLFPIIVFFLNTSITHFAKDTIFADVDKLVDLIFQFYQNNIISDAEFNSLLVFIASALLNLIQKFPKMVNNASLKKIFNKFIDRNGINDKKLALEEICFKAKMKNSDKIEDLFSIFSNGSPLDYHVASLIILDMITNSKSIEKKIDLIYQIILAISQTVSGRQSFIMDDFPFFNTDTAYSSFMFKYAPLIISGCSELIQICRKLLNQNDKEMINVITFILDNQAEIDYKNFYSKFENDKNLLFGVFAILSNLIEEIHPNSLIKNTKTNQIYYIVSINLENSVCTVWQLPINSNSVQMNLNLTSEFVPISLMPFQVNLFDSYSLLIPYFNDALNGKLNPGLSILILASLKEYSTNQSFLQEFIKVLNPSFLSSIDYTYSLPSYLKLLHSHLNQKSDGFFEKVLNDQFLLFNISNPHQSFSSKILTDDNSNYKMLLLTSSVIPIDNNFTINLKINCQNYDVGVYCPSLSENTDHLFYSKRSQESDSNSDENVRIIYNKLMGVAIIIESPLKPQTFSKKIDKPFCLILNLLSTATVDFSFNKDKNDDETTVNELCLSPTKRNEISLIEHEDSYVENSFMMIPYSVITSLPTSFSLMNDLRDSIKQFPIYYNLQKEINSWLTEENCLRIPPNQSIYQYHSKSENLIVFSQFKNIICVNKFNGESFIISSKDVQAINFLPFFSLSNCSVLPSSLINYYATGIVSECRNQAMNWIFINLATHSNLIPFEQTIKLFNLTEKDLLKHVLNLLLLLEPTFKNIDQLTAETAKTTDKIDNTNSTDTEDNADYKNEKEKNNTKFSYEKVQIIDFEYNSFSNESELRMTSLQVFSSAMLKIIEYIDKRGIQNEFADNWLHLLTNQFLNGFQHSCIPSSASSTSSVFVNMYKESSPVVVSRGGILGWIVCSVCFSSNYSTSEEIEKEKNKTTHMIRGLCRINDILITDPLTVILNPSLSIEFKKKNKTIVLIPIVSNSNDTLIGTFFDLALSFKYFVYYISSRKAVLKKCQFYKTQVYRLFFRGVLSKSPFFFTFTPDIVSFLRQNQALVSADIEGDFVLALNLLSLYCFKAPKLLDFLNEAEELWNERILISMAVFFPEFMTDETKKQIEEEHITASDTEFNITSSFIPDEIHSNENLTSIISKTKRVLKKFDSLSGFPYHILLQEWAKFTILYPPYDVKFISPTIAQITFSCFTPSFAVINVNQDENGASFKIYDNINMSSALCVNEGDIFGVSADTIYIECVKNAISSIDFAVTSPLPKHIKNDDDKDKVLKIPIDQFIFHHRRQFTSDMLTFSIEITSHDDQQILCCFSDKVFKKKKTLTFEILTDDPMIFSGCNRSLHYKYHLIVLRAKLLLILNWLASIQTDLLESDPEFRSLLPSISVLFKLSLFNEEINKLSYDKTSVKLVINRKEAANVRLGASDDLNKTIISQMAREYSDPAKYRCKSDQPWKVRFVNEVGIDAGGLARELVNECAVDFMCPLCGLVVPVPNAINGVGENGDTVIPMPSPRYDQIRLENMYKFCGALIAICIRTGLVQQFLFPPLVWEYLLSGHISIQRVFEIDKNYELLITSLTEAVKSDMTNDEFVERFNLKYVVLNAVGVECPLNQRGKSIVVDKSNCNDFIACANKFRINELEASLRPMKEGFWSNLGIKPLPIIDWQTLEFAACGQSEISLDALMKVTNFDGIEKDQQSIFWRVVEGFSQKQRSDLLKFATGRVRLPPKHDQQSKFLIIDSISGTDILPTASTCFHKLHYPTYSSVEIASKMIRIAIEYSGTFENA